MKQRFPFRILALLLACCLVFSGCSNGVIERITENLRKYKQGSSHTGGGQTDWADFSEAPENSFYSFLSEYKQSANLSGLTPLGLKPETPQTGPADDWGDTPVPLINPLGSKALYNGVQYGNSIGYSGESLTFTYLEGFSEVSKTIRGQERWELKIDTNGGDVLPFVREYAEKLGAEFYTTTSDGEMAFSIRQPEAYYWCTAVYSERASEVQVDMVKARVFAMNKAYKITKDMYDENGNFEFLLDMPGKKFTQILCEVPDGGLILEISQTVNSDSMKAEIGNAMNMFSKEYTHYTIYSCPQDAGLYRVLLRQGYEAYKSVPSEFTITFHETEYDLPGYKPGGIGELVVKNVPYGRVRAVTQKNVRIDNKLTGDSYGYDLGAYGQMDCGIPIGDDLYFSLPAGYYTLEEELGLGNGAQTQLVPVSAGERTTVFMPESWRAASKALAPGDDDRELTGSIEIGKMTDKEKTAELALTVSDPYDRDVFPTKENTVITESGQRVKIVDIKRKVAPCSVALVLDSSGSMADDMKATIEAAKRFVKSLPDSSFVKIVDFAGYVKALPGGTKEEALKALSGIKSQGSTMLYDATMEGIKQVLKKTRPAVIVFTDGVDSREAPGTGKGSKSTKDEVVKRIIDTGVPVYTIGFGKRLNDDEELAKVDGAPDIACLIEFAATSGGEYFPAKQTDALDAVFTAISSKLGNNFIITYNRPTENNISDTPVYSMVIDNSGSMNTSPEEDPTCNFRMEKTKQLLADFIGKLPQNAIAQLTTFQGGGEGLILTVKTRQMPTTDKAILFKALGEMSAHDATPIVESLNRSYENIISVPTSKRVIVYLSDCNLEDTDAYGYGHEKYWEILDKIKDKGIHMLWIGLGVSTPEWKEHYAAAAKRTGGEYVISESPADIMPALEKLLQKVAQAGENRSAPITVDLSYKTDEGELVTYKAQATADFSPPEKKGKPVEPDYIRFETGEKLDLASGAAMMTPAQKSAGLPGTDSVLFMSVPVGKTMKNNAMELTVQSVSYFDKLMGLDASGNHYRFAAFEVELKNATEKKIPYRIPSIFNHFYAGINGGQYPASKATWLMDKPVTIHGDPMVEIPPGGTVAGTLVFLIPYADYTQVSLHFYDTAYGHIQMPIAGASLDKWTEMEKLPTEATGKLSDTFTMNVTASEVKTGIDQYKPGSAGAFRVVEANFSSNVQALLDINPAQRVWLRYPSKSGDLLAPMSPVTQFMPMGFWDQVMLGPGSDNIVRLAYDVPARLDKHKCELYFDIATGSAVFGVKEGKPYGAPAPAAEFDTEFMKVRVNQLVQLQEDLEYPSSAGWMSRFSKGTVLLDVTFIDKPSADGYQGTQIPADFFTLVNKNYESPYSAGGVPGSVIGSTGHIGLGGPTDGSKELLNPSYYNKGLIFGMEDGLSLFGSMSRRAIVVFDKPEDDISGWTLQSRYYENIDAPVTEGAFASPELIAYKAEVRETPEFLLQLDEAVDKAVKKYAALGSGSYNPVIRMESPETDGKRSVDIPSINTYGVRRMEAMKTEEDFVSLMRGTECIPKMLLSPTGLGVKNNYAPESVLTQGFGDQGSVVNAAAVLLTKLGFTPEKKPLALTGQGKKALEGYYKFAPGDDFVPAGIAYTNDKGERKMFVVPFMADISELAGYVYNPAESKADFGGTSGTATVQVYVQYMAKPTDTAAIGGGGLWGGLTEATGGAETDEVATELLMLEKELPLDMLSTDAVDIGFLTVPGNSGERTVAFLTTPEGEVYGKESISPNAKIIGIKTVVKGISGWEDLVNWNTVPVGARLDHHFLTLGINLPDLPEGATMVLQNGIDKLQAEIDNPDNLSYMKWLHRGSIFSFIAMQTGEEKNMAEFGGLVVGRLDTPRCIVMMSRVSTDGNIYTCIDLAQAFNEIHNQENLEEDTVKGFNALSGLFMSELEKFCLQDENAVGYQDLWAKLPRYEGLLENGDAASVLELISDDKEQRESVLEMMEEQGGYPLALLEAVKNTDKVILTPIEPVIYNGEERWAWLEIDPKTNQTISVFDNGQHSAMTENVIKQWESFATGMAVGAFVGVLSFKAFHAVALLRGMTGKEAADNAFFWAILLGSVVKWGTSLSAFLSPSDLEKLAQFGAASLAVASDAGEWPIGFDFASDGVAILAARGRGQKNMFVAGMGLGYDLGVFAAYKNAIREPGDGPKTKPGGPKPAKGGSGGP